MKMDESVHLFSGYRKGYFKALLDLLSLCERSDGFVSLKLVNKKSVKFYTSYLKHALSNIDLMMEMGGEVCLAISPSGEIVGMYRDADQARQHSKTEELQ